MLIHLTGERIAALRALFDNSPDAQATGVNEYVVDFYEVDPPISAELALAPDGINVLAAETMAFDEEMRGWYLAGPVTRPEPIERALESFI